MVLSNEWMGAFCLGVVWLNALLIAWHVLRSQRALALAMGTAPILTARVIEATDGPLALVRVLQAGHAITTGGPERILFTERKRSVERHAVVAEIDGARTSLALADDAAVWTEAQGTRATESFDRLHADASTSRGASSELRIEVGASGQSIFVAATRAGEGMRAVLVADRDPRAIVAEGRRKALAFVVLSLVILAGITALALVRPWFTGWSTLGGALGVAYFLAVQPLAVSLREGIAPPPERRITSTLAR